MNKNGGVGLPIEVMSQENQCYELIQSTKCKLGVSKVHGIGVLAIRDIKKGDKVYCGLAIKPRWYTVSHANLQKYIEKTVPEIYQLILERWTQVLNGAPFLSPNYDQRLTSFMNHSDTPNYDPETDTATEDIKAGEEVFEDYRVIPRYEIAFPWLKKDGDSK